MTYAKCTFGKQIFFFLVDYTKQADQIERLFSREFPPRVPEDVVMHIGPTEVCADETLTKLCVNADTVIAVHFKVKVGADEHNEAVFVEFWDENADQEKTLADRRAELQEATEQFRRQQEEEERQCEEQAKKEAMESAARGRKMG